MLAFQIWFNTFKHMLNQAVGLTDLIKVIFNATYGFGEYRPVRVWVFFEEAGTFHENKNLFAIKNFLLAL